MTCGGNLNIFLAELGKVDVPSLPFVMSFVLKPEKRLGNTELACSWKGKSTASIPEMFRVGSTLP